MTNREFQIKKWAHDFLIAHIKSGGVNDQTIHNCLDRATLLYDSTILSSFIVEKKEVTKPDRGGDLSGVGVIGWNGIPGGRSSEV